MANQDEQGEIARKLAQELREVADCVEKAGDGDEQAKRIVRGHVDSYWNRIILGGEDLSDLLDPAEGVSERAELIQDQRQ